MHLQSFSANNLHCPSLYSYIIMKPVFILGLLVLTACGQKKATPGPVTTLFKPDTAAVRELVKNDFPLQKDSVRDFIDKVTPAHQKLAQPIFANGLDFYHNQKNPNLAATHLLQAMQLSPTATGYYELANVFVDLKQYDSAEKSFEIGELLGYQPMAKLLFDKARMFALHRNEYEALFYIRHAFDAGHTQLNEVQSDPVFAEVRKLSEFKIWLSENTASKSANPKQTEFDIFSSQFSRTSFPKVLQAYGTDSFEYQNRISSGFEYYLTEMRNEMKFSRMVGLEIYAIHQINRTKNYTALTFETYEFIGVPPKTCIYLATYSPEGKIISKVNVSFLNESEKTYTTCKFLGPNSFVLYKYKAIVSENKVIAGASLGQITYAISEQGLIEEIKPHDI